MRSKLQGILRTLQKHPYYEMTAVEIMNEELGKFEARVKRPQEVVTAAKTVLKELR